MLLAATGQDNHGRTYTVTLTRTPRSKDVTGNREYVAKLKDNTGYEFSPIYLYAPNDVWAGIVLERNLSGLHILVTSL